MTRAMTRARELDARVRGRRVRESFEKMRAHARWNRFRRARRGFVESSAVYGTIFAEDAARAARRARETCDDVERDARAFARDVAVSEDEDEDDTGDERGRGVVGEANEEEDARKTRAATYDVERLRKCFQEREADAKTRVGTAARAIEETLRVARANVEEKFFDELDARFRPMLAAVERRRRRSSGTNARDHVSGDGDNGRPRDAYPHTTRALRRAFDAKCASFERRVWMTLSIAVSQARRASFAEFLAHVSGKTSEPFFATTLRAGRDDGRLTLDPDADAFVRVVRDAGARWTSNAMAEETNGRVTLDDEDAFARFIERACDETREAFQTAETFVVDLVNLARERCEEVRRAREDDEPIARFGAVATRADAFAREMDAVAGVVRPHDACVVIDVSSVVCELRAAAMGAMESAAATAVEWASARTQEVAHALTRLKLEERDDKSERAREMRKDTRSLADAYATLKASRAAIPDLHVAAFDDLEREIDAFARDVAADDDRGDDDGTEDTK